MARPRRRSRRPPSCSPTSPGGEYQPVFTPEERAEVRIELIQFAKDDQRVLAGAEVGSLTVQGDRWSDLDLTFGLVPGAGRHEVLDGWSVELNRRWGAVQLFALESVGTVYR